MFGLLAGSGPGAILTHGQVARVTGVGYSPPIEHGLEEAVHYLCNGSCSACQALAKAVI